MQDMKKLKNSDKVKALQSFLENEKSYEIDYDAESLQKAIKDFLNLKTAYKTDDLPDLIENFVSHYQGKKELLQVSKVDYSKTTNSDLIDEALQPLRGVMTILTSMALSTRSGDDEHQSQAYDVLHNICNNVLDKFEELKGEIDYMEDVIRGDVA